MAGRANKDLEPLHLSLLSISDIISVLRTQLKEGKDNGQHILSILGKHRMISE
jgi:hypothetical protein